ncbi:hypothetical protein B0H16DRAFT_1450648 [Mycena metata]|uniref:Aminoglycoside phosphotransferase domain-containing protein n=1 Tax=Mycena metata TaxID=1033252 RepID=A0AAD7JXJ3_9AGAR|nr:hypothetical protein B0H16DRAFT_1450648 [Mycena metata]
MRTEDGPENGEKVNGNGNVDAAPPLEWDWDIEHADRKREAQADAALHGATPFEVDRRVLKDVVMEHMKTPVARIVFLSAGTFHKAWAAKTRDDDRGGPLRLQWASERGEWLPEVAPSAFPSRSLRALRARAYLITLTTAFQLVARVARRFMPRLKTESEIATLRFLATRAHANMPSHVPRSLRVNVPVPEVYRFDANPYNRLGGEYIIMEKAQGVPLASVYHTLGYAQLVRLLENLAKLVIPLYGHRFPKIGSLYCGPDPAAPRASPASSHAPTPTLTRVQSAFVSDVDTPRASAQSTTFTGGGFPFLPILTPRLPPAPSPAPPSTLLCSQHQGDAPPQFYVGPIISWPFFGSHRGTLPSAVPRGPFATTSQYFAACIEREVLAVQRENAGAAGQHKLHLDPAEIRSSRHHHVAGVPGDESDESDEWGLEESEDEWEGPGDAMYTDYRRGQRGAFLVAHTMAREEAVRAELGRWMRVVERLRSDWEAGSERAGVGWGKVKDGEEGEEEFALDAHDLSLENVFVSAEDPTVITCIIDWESTTTRPLWAAAHLPAFLQSSPFTAKLFREAVARLASPSTSPSKPNGNGDASADAARTAALAREWLHHERTGMRLRMAHRVVEWDGWEEGLVESILGPEELEEEWFVDPDAEGDACEEDEDHDQDHDEDGHHEDGEVDGTTNGANGNGDVNGDSEGAAIAIGRSLSRRRPEGGVAEKKSVLPLTKAKPKGGTTTTGKLTGKLFAKNLEREKEQMLDTTGDICGGRGGELGRRLEAWLTVSENASPEEEDGPAAGIDNGYEAKTEAN